MHKDSARGERINLWASRNWLPRFSKAIALTPNLVSVDFSKARPTSVHCVRKSEPAAGSSIDEFISGGAWR